MMGGGKSKRSKSRGNLMSGQLGPRGVHAEGHILETFGPRGAHEEGHIFSPRGTCGGARAGEIWSPLAQCGGTHIGEIWYPRGTCGGAHTGEIWCPLDGCTYGWIDGLIGRNGPKNWMDAWVATWMSIEGRLTYKDNVSQGSTNMENKRNLVIGNPPRIRIW